MRYFIAIWIFGVVAVVSILGFRGAKSTRQPIYVFPDMDWQAKYLPQGENKFFADGRNDRPVVPGTVGRGYGSQMKEVFSADYVDPVSLNPPMYSGKDADGEWVRGFPVEVTDEFMQLGQQKFTIFCAVCHGAAGDGNGVTKQFGMAATPTYHDARIRGMAEGEIFNTITHGKNLMGAYGMKLRPEERWAVIAYVRALQLAQQTSIEDVPEQFKPELGL
ncbi:cytochrome c [Ruficoccus sp. ZRK36]|uniref:c-type cytochrome n=1 Tax=Ruficoccus sp. ZRK36 TaxID=2866311 RepID=UPI001C737DB7|nr:cytochrome c [Ruficoccus sp. ZRK36]QYY36096.1 cytochrome c [Ruficoccus sp. ZRK36]